MKPACTSLPVSRRAFIEAGTATGAALLIGFRWGPDALAQAPGERLAPNPFDAWIRVAGDGSVTLTLAKSEMGQGVSTSLPMILAEELDVDWTRVRVEQALVDPHVYNHSTGGSTSIRTSWAPLRQAGAAARRMLLEAAADAWKADPGACHAELGFVHGPGGRTAAYGALVEAASKRPIPDLKTVALKDPQEYRIVGTSPPRIDAPPKLDGSARFGLDVRVPGLLYAVIARCPTFGGKVARFDAAAARAVRGVRHVVEIPPVGEGVLTTGGVAVVADGTWAGIRGREALRVEWDHGPHAGESSGALRKQFEELLGRPGTVVRDDGDAVAALGAASRRMEAVYEVPFEAHATMEPMNATVHVRADGVEAWLPSQGPQWPQEVMARIAGVAPEKVRIRTTLLGGGFGRRFHRDFSVEAAQVSKAVGAPVQVVWTREDDIQHDSYRPAALHRLSAALDERGRPSAWLHRMASTSISAFWGPPGTAKPEESEIGGSVDLPYAIPNLRVEYAPAASAVPVMWWRSVAHSGNAFVVEAFLDELAAAAGLDPLELRRRLLAEPREVRNPADPESVLDTRRLAAVLERAAEMAGWGGPLPSGRGRGIAGHFSFHTYVAHVAEVSVERGRVRVHRVVCAVDCGRVVNPDGVRAQMESGIAYGLSAALKGAITISNGRCEQSNFHDFDVLRIDEMPAVEVHIVPSDAPPTGTGEPGLPPVAPAVANAVYAATGRRVRRLPIRGDDLTPS
jgi:isoquinoline 1-oxidoreductase beta subunit